MQVHIVLKYMYIHVQLNYTCICNFWGNISQRKFTGLLLKQHNTICFLLIINHCIKSYFCLALFLPHHTCKQFCHFYLHSCHFMNIYAISIHISSSQRQGSLVYLWLHKYTCKIIMSSFWKIQSRRVLLLECRYRTCD